MSGLRVPEPEVPQYAPLEGAAPQQEYWQPAGPRLGLDAEGENSRAYQRSQSRLIGEANMLKHLE